MPGRNSKKSIQRRRCFKHMSKFYGRKKVWLSFALAYLWYLSTRAVAVLDREVVSVSPYLKLHVLI
jgi:hypothetical protein